VRGEHGITPVDLMPATFVRFRQSENSDIPPK
jgi:hypothetical protein